MTPRLTFNIFLFIAGLLSGAFLVFEFMPTKTIESTQDKAQIKLLEFQKKQLRDSVNLSNLKIQSLLNLNLESQGKISEFRKQEAKLKVRVPVKAYTKRKLDSLFEERYKERL